MKSTADTPAEGGAAAERGSHGTRRGQARGRATRARLLDADRRTDVQLERFLGEDPHGAVHGWLRRSYERLREQPSIYLVALAAANRDAELAEAYCRIEALGVERLRRLLVFGQARGVMRPDLDPESAAFLIHETIDAAANRLFVRDPLGPEADRVVAELGDMICRYILIEPASPPGE